MDVGTGLQLNIDWLYMLRSGKAFAAGTAQAASVGNLTEIQLFNPVASGVTIIVHRILMSRPTQGDLEVRSHNAALATLVNVGRNLAFFGTAGKGELRTATPVAADGTILWNVTLLADTVYPWTAEGFAVMDPGEGIHT